MNNWKDAIFLVSYTSTKDADGFYVGVEDKSEEIPANFKSVTRAEEEHSKKMGYKAKLIVEVMKCNYDNQEVLIDSSTNKKYSIQRSYEISSEILELTCSDISKKNN